MTRQIFVALAVVWLAWTASYSLARATTFVGATIEMVDPSRQTLTFKTRDGQSRTLPVADPRLLGEKQLAKGDYVSLEVDLNERISHVVKLETYGTAPQEDPGVNK